MASQRYDALTPKILKHYTDLGMTPEQLNKSNEMERQNIEAVIKQYHLDDKKANGSPKKELKLVLLGKTGAGKSTIGNIIIGTKTFEASNSAESCTTTIQCEEVYIDGVRIRVIDTPGLCDTSACEKVITTEIAKVIEVFSDGIDGFLFVYSMGNPRFTKEESDVFTRIEKGLFGPTFLDHCYVIITHAKKLKEFTLEQYIENEKKDFGQLIKHTLKRKVVGVEDAIETVYGKQRQREELVRTLQSGLTGIYSSDIFREICKEREEAAREFDKCIRDLIPTINDLLIKKFEGKVVGDIEQMVAVDDDDFCAYVFKEVKPLVKSTWPTDTIQQEREEKQLRKAIASQFELMKKRLTSPLAKVKEFVLGLMSAAGVMFQPVVEAGAAWFIGKMVKAFTK